MGTGLASVRDGRGLDSVDRAVRTLEDEWHRGEPRLEQLWGEDGTGGSVSVLAVLVKADLRCRYARGQHPSVADYLERFPALRDQGDRVLSLIYEEFCLREEQGEQPVAEQFCARYPSWSDSLASQLRYHKMLSQVVAPSSPPARFPEIGEYFEEYQLERLLGKGAAAQVYLAHDASLGGRPVALKISPDRGQEPSIMGRLDHADIVPVHSVVFQHETQLRGLCMPFRPGLALDEIIKRISPASVPQTARALRAVVEETAKELEQGRAPADSRAEARQPGWNGYPIHGTYAEGVAWVVAALARALGHAHARGILHRDVKPANILMTLRDGPQLLDFNLSHDPHSANQAVAAMRGGTLPYMAPEQLEAFLDPERWDDVHAGADLYSLGLVLCEMLTGQPPDAPGQGLPPARAIRELIDRRRDSRTALRPVNPTVPHALEAIAERCLAPSPADRYPDASALADDLRRFLDRRPLIHAVNPSRRERGANWLWRRRRVLVPAGLLLVVACLLFAYRGLRRMIPIENRAEFLEAVGNAEKGEWRETLPMLESLVDERPDSPLARAYLSIALFRTGDPNTGAKQLNRALISPSVKEANTALTSWGRSHLRLAGNLAWVGNQLDGRGFEDTLVRSVFLLAEQIDPACVEAHQGAATLEARLQHFPEAVARMTTLIGKAERKEMSDVRVNFAEWYLQRAKYQIYLAREKNSRAQGQISEEARSLLRQALDDCARGRDHTSERDKDHASRCLVIEAEALNELQALERRAGWPETVKAASK